MCCTAGCGTIGVALHAGSQGEVAEAEQQVVAIDEAHRADDVVHGRRQALEVRVVADHQQAAAPLDELLDRRDFRRAVAMGRAS